MSEGPSRITGPIPPDPTLCPDYYRRPLSGQCLLMSGILMNSFNSAFNVFLLLPVLEDSENFLQPKPLVLLLSHRPFPDFSLFRVFSPRKAGRELPEIGFASWPHPARVQPLSWVL